MLARDPRRTASTVLTHAAPFVLWVGILLLRPHKEERFLFPAFPSLYIGAAASLAAVAVSMGALGAKFVTPRTTRRFITYVVLGAAALLGVSRMAALAVYYDHGQMTAWRAAAATAAKLGPEVTVCAGSSGTSTGTLLLPSNARLSFVRSSLTASCPALRVRRGPARYLAGTCVVSTTTAARIMNMWPRDCDVAVDLPHEGDPPLP